MSKLNQEIQGHMPTHIFKCYCGEDSYLEIMQDPDDKEFYLTITKHPTRLKERLKLAWKAFRGLEFAASNEVIIAEKDAKKIAKALETAS